MTAPTPSARTRRLLTVGLIAGAGLLAAACSSGGNGSATATTTTPSGSPTSAGPAALVKTMTVGNLGSILVNSQGQVLYSFTNGSGASVPCSASCLTLWPAVTLPNGVSTPTGATGVGTLGTTTANGPTQVTVNGLPLYTYAGDSGPGVAKGNDLVSFGGTWKVVKAQ
jgi:predicted lipoprotein with Yx(FWY)xxD motif